MRCTSVCLAPVAARRETSSRSATFTFLWLARSRKSLHELGYPCEFGRSRTFAEIALEASACRRAELDTREHPVDHDEPESP
jgi:hypothetical protein